MRRRKKGRKWHRKIRKVEMGVRHQHEAYPKFVAKEYTLSSLGRIAQVPGGGLPKSLGKDWFT